MPKFTPSVFQRCLNSCAQESRSMRAGDRPRRIVGLLARRIEQHMDCVADDLGDRAFMREHDVGHALRHIR